MSLDMHALLPLARRSVAPASGESRSSQEAEP